MCAQPFIHAHLLFKQNWEKREAFHCDERHFGVSLDAHLLHFIEFIDRFIAGTRAPNRQCKEIELIQAFELRLVVSDGKFIWDSTCDTTKVASISLILRIRSLQMRIFSTVERLLMQSSIDILIYCV